MGIIKNKNMKKIKTKIILSAVIFLLVAGFVGTANATTASLYVSPASLTKIAGDIFGVSVGFNASGNKVCAVEGTIVFNNLTCQSITIASDVMAQSSPTCSNPHFLIGIPNCTMADKALFTASVKAGSAGPASISLISVDVIGEGVSVGSASINGSYTINAVPTSISEPISEPVSEPTIAPISKPTQKPTSKPETETVTTTEEETAVVQSEEQRVGEKVSFLAAIGNIMTFGTGNVLISILVGLLVFVIAAYVTYMSAQKKRKNSGKI